MCRVILVYIKINTTHCTRIEVNCCTHTQKRERKLLSDAVYAICGKFKSPGLFFYVKLQSIDRIEKLFIKSAENAPGSFFFIYPIKLNTVKTTNIVYESIGYFALTLVFFFKER